MLTASAFLDMLIPPWRASAGADTAYFDGFVRRKRQQLEAMLEPLVAAFEEEEGEEEEEEEDEEDEDTEAEAPGYAAVSEPVEDPVEAWTPKRRTDANLAALDVLARHRAGTPFSAAEVSTVLGYSGWGGLSVEKYEDHFPEGLHPGTFGLIHEYYTPKRVADEIARVLCPLLPSVAVNGVVRALEPSAGIGRLLRAMSGRDCGVQVEWTAIELSRLSAQLLASAVPGLSVIQSSFENWNAQYFASRQGSFDLVLSNPPYGDSRGLWATEDPERKYREDAAYAYFMRRGLDLLRTGGLGVFIVPAGFLTGKAAASLRIKVLRRHHLLEAFRLPSQMLNNRPLFPGAGLVVDVLFFQARGGTLAAIDPDDQFIVDGEYFEHFAQNILGEVTPNGRGRYSVVADFTHLPDLTPRPMCASCVIKPLQAPRPGPTPRTRGVVRNAEVNTEGLDPTLATAVHLGMRVDTYFALVAASDAERPAALWLELSRALEAFVEAHGNPWQMLPLRNLADGGSIGAQRFLSAFTRTGGLIDGLRAPPVVERRYAGRPDDVVAQAEMLFKSTRLLTLTQLAIFHAQVGGMMSLDGIRHAMLSADWYLDGNNWDELVPRDVYLTGELWPKYDRAAAQPPEDLQAAKQSRALLDAIAPAVFEDIDNISPRDSWLPLDMVAAWMRDTINRKNSINLERKNGLVLPRDIPLSEISGYLAEAKESRKVEEELAEIEEKVATNVKEREELIATTGTYDRWSAERELEKEKRRLQKTLARLREKLTTIEAEASSTLTSESLWFLGWLNHDMTTFKPGHSKDEKLDDVRIWYAKEWTSRFKAWLSQTPARRDQIRDVYNRTFKGFVAPTYTPTPLDIVRYSPDAPRLHPWQIAGARRILANRGGLLAFDVGVGKTYTALALLAKARQDGWVRRPVVLVPTSIVWKWYKDFKRLLPDYRVGVVGSKQRILKGGEEFKKASTLLAMGRITQEAYERAITTSEPDTPEDRAATWTALQSGQLDAVLLTYDALQRTRMNEDAVVAYAEKAMAIQRAVELMQRNMEGRKTLTERAKAVKEHGVRGWVAQRMEIPEKWRYDPGIAWDDIGIDMLIVDEAAAFKNLYMPEKREFGIPRFMGNAGEGSKRAWQLDFRIAAIRRHTGGSGIVLLTATPAKNSPLEYYNMIQYIDPKAFERLGIDNPEQFIDRYLKILPQQVIGMTGDVATRSAVVGFLHLPELRGILFRYGEFASVQFINQKYPQAQIALPKLTLPEARVELDEAQEEKYSAIVSQMEMMIEKKETGQLLGLLARLSLIAVHAEMDEGYGWNTALSGGVSRRQVPATSVDNWLERGWKLDDSPAKRLVGQEIEVIADDDDGEDTVRIMRTLPKPSYDSPKFTAVAEHIAAKPDCGHIVFCEPVASHQWLREVFVQHGIKRERIAILNAIASSESAERQRIAEDFNGDPEIGRPALYDVVIANSVAYEGIDLQRRTCSIHHVDFPWTPADLEQRNGRGYRQGNKLAEIQIIYYFAERSLDGFRFDSINNKARWQDELIYGKGRETNNPGAQMNLTPDQLLVMISRNPARTTEVLEKVREKAEAEARLVVAKNAARILGQANARMRDARSTDDMQQAARLRGEAEVRLTDLAKIDPSAWPWARWLTRIRDVDYMVPEEGEAPVYEGLRVGKPSVYRSDETDYFEFGRHISNAEGGGVIGLRAAGAPKWIAKSVAEVVSFKLTPADYETGMLSWPDDTATTAANIRAELQKQRGRFNWTSFGWRLASDGWLETWWPRFSKTIMESIVDSNVGEDPIYPVEQNGALVIMDLAMLDDLGTAGGFDNILPPTLAGFDRLLSLAPASRLTYQKLDEVARFWWNRPFPRGLLTHALRAAKMAAGENGGTITENLRRPARRYWDLPHPHRMRAQTIDDRPSTTGGARRRVLS